MMRLTPIRKKPRRPPTLLPCLEKEICSILDKAVLLPYGHTVFYHCTESRARFLANYGMGEVYCNAVLSIVTYNPDEPLYGKGLYYHLNLDPQSNGLAVTSVEYPLSSATWDIISCAATKTQVISQFPPTIVRRQLVKMKDRFPFELRGVFYATPRLFWDNEDSSGNFLMETVDNTGFSAV